MNKYYYKGKEFNPVIKFGDEERPLDIVGIDQMVSSPNILYLILSSDYGNITVQLDAKEFEMEPL